jgi:hypothetical protein
LEEFRNLVRTGNLAQALSDYELDFNEAEFDANQDGARIVVGYEAQITWQFEEPHKIKMFKTPRDGNGKSIYYLPWAPKAVTKVTLDGTTPGYFVTSHFSNCRFTMSFHDNEAKTVTVQHVAGDTNGTSSTRGTAERYKMEIPVPEAVRTRRFSVTGLKRIGRAGAVLMEER